MGVPRAQNDAVDHAGERQVVDVAAAALDEARILEAGHRLTKRVLSHVFSPVWRRRGRARRPAGSGGLRC